MTDLLYGQGGTADENAELLTQEAATEVPAAKGLLAVGASQAAVLATTTNNPHKMGKVSTYALLTLTSKIV